MKGLLFIGIAFLCSSICHAQYLRTAIELDTNNNNQYKANLLWKLIGKTGEVNRDALVLAYADNPFFENLDEIIGHSFTGTYSSSDAAKIQLYPTGGISSGISVTNFVDGLAGFMIKRAKQELTLGFFTDLQKKIEECHLCKNIFPRTEELMKRVVDELENVDYYLGSMRESFIKDLEVLPTNLSGYLDTSAHVSIPGKIISKDLLSAAQLLLDDSTAFGIVRYLSSNSACINDARLSNLGPLNKIKFGNIGAGYKILDLVLKSFAISEREFVSGSELNRLRESGKTLDLFLGILYQTGKDIKFGTGKTFGQALKEFKLRGYTKKDKLIRHSTGFVNSAKAAVLSIKEFPEENRTYNDYYKVFAHSFDMLKSGVEIANMFHTSGNEAVNVLLALENTNEMLFDLRQKRYTSSLLNMIEILDVVVGKEFKGRKVVLRYGGFIAAIAEAKTPEQYSNAIENFALPVGSSRIKKKSKFSVMLSSYAGGAYSREVFYNETTTGIDVARITGPIGISADIGISDKNQYLGFTVSLIDIGAVLSYKINGDADVLPELDLKNIVAPGFLVNWGMGKHFPHTLSLGAVLGPHLRGFGESGMGEYGKVWSFRVGYMLDMPLTSIYVR